tara:strand:+ start:725 stop:955 length:231 start_codon:yes stop_codon:yes gene_type:complete
MKPRPTIRRVLASLFERSGQGLTSWEATELLGVKYNSASIALARLHREGWCTVQKERPENRTGRPCKRYTIKEDTA